MLVVSILLSLYFFSVLMFSLVSHSVYYCVLLIVSSIIGSWVSYSIYGFGWYSVLFCLVYIGGVYILFVFVSVFNPNNNLISYYSFNYFGLFVVVFSGLLVGVFWFFGVLNIEFSEYICTIMEGGFYICMCVGLIFGFLILSMVISIKMNRFR